MRKIQGIRSIALLKIIYKTKFMDIGYPIKAERLYEELYKKTKRWTYKGKPTKKAQKLTILEKRMTGLADAYNLLLKR